MGLVFGDIGTSPIYTLTVIFALSRPTPDDVFGIISLIFWTLVLLVTVQYAWLAMSLGYKGQGGGIMLRETLVKVMRKGRAVSVAGFITYIGVSLLLGDGVITPAISILSAVEGTLLIPGLENIGQHYLILIAALIAVGLFSIQHRGTDKVAWTFGPIMVVWFSALAVSGVLGLQHALSERFFPMPLAVVLPAMMIPSLTVAGVAEGAYTVFALSLLRKAKLRGVALD